MTITTWPIDAVAAVPGRQLREAHSVYMVGASATDPFGVRSGVRPGTSPTTVTATSTTWTVGAHAGVVDLQPAVEASGYAYAVNATGGLPTGAVTAADLTRPRVDIVWVRNDDPAEGDASPNPTVVFGYTAGAPLAIPVAPATPARCMVLATISVPLSGGGAPTVIWVAPYTVAAGAPTPVWSQADRDAKFPTPYDGLQVYRLDLHVVERYDGTAWVGGAWIAPALGSSWVNYGGTDSTAGYRKTTDGDVALRGSIKSGTGGTIFTLPVGYRPLSKETITVASWAGSAQLGILATGEVTVFNYSGGGSNAAVYLTGTRFSTL